MRTGNPGDDPGRSRRESEGAAFESVRVGGGRRRPPLSVIAVLGLVAGIVAIGVAGRESTEVVGSSAAAVGTGTGASAGPAASRVPVSTPPALPGTSAGSSPDRAPVVEGGSGPIELRARRHPETMFVHGDVFVDDVTWVFVSLMDDGGRVAGWASVSLPGGARPPEGDQPSLRFDVEVAIPEDRFSGRLWVQAMAYDARGLITANARLEVPADGAAPASSAGAAGADDAASASPGAAVWNLWPPERNLAAEAVPVRLVQPAFGPLGLAARSVHVEGTLLVRADTVHVALFDEAGAALAERTIRTNPDGGIRPVRAPIIDVELPIPSPGLVGGPLRVVVTVLDPWGRSLGVVERAVRVAPLGG